MTTTSLTAGEVMDRSAALLNDPAKTDYTYVAQLPYLNMALDELMEELEASNSSPTNQTASLLITIPVGTDRIKPIDYPGTGPRLPDDLVEVQEVAERLYGSQDSFTSMGKREHINAFPAAQSLLAWSWEDQSIKFNPNGATSVREIRLRYISQFIFPLTSENDLIGIINARSYLTYKTAALCALYIGENETRATVLEMQAERSLDRIIGINNKGRQTMGAVRHRPFRASYKSRGGF